MSLRDALMHTEPSRIGLPLDMFFAAACLLKEPSRSILVDLWTKKGPGGIAFEGVGSWTTISIERTLAVLHHERISDSVIDATCEIMQDVYQDHKTSQSTMIFTSKCWGMIANDAGKNKTLKVWVDDRLEEATKKEVLLFPLLTCGESSNRRHNADHWTLLKYTVKAREWRFFNSMKSRAGRKDPHLHNSLCVVSYVEDRLRVLRQEDVSKIGPYKLPIVVDCPQQEPDSLDCGVAVLHLIRNSLLRIYKKQTKFTHDESAAMRALLVEWMLDPASRHLSM